MTARELATELEVSVRTVYRDLDALAAAGVPVYAERGPGGGYRLVEGYRTTLTGLTEEEAQALFFTGLPGPAAELGLATAVAAARAKVLVALPDRVREAATLVHDRFHLDPGGWFRSPPEHPHLESVASAIWGARRLAIVYRRGDGEVVERLLCPLGLVLKAGAWYLVADAEHGRRAYRVSRIRQAQVGETTFERPEGFDLGGFWDAWVEEFEEGLDEYPVLIRVSPERVWRLPLLGDAVTRGRGHTPESDRDGWIRRTLVFERLEWARSQLLGFGPGIEVLEPAELREAMQDAASELADVYLGKP